MKLNKLLRYLNQNKHTVYMLLIFLAGNIFFATLVLLNRRIVGSDDTVFQTQILPYHNIFDWIVYRYQTWSGRIFSEGFMYVFSPAPLYFWQLASIFIYSLFSGMLFTYYKLFSKNQSPSKNRIMLIIALCLPFLTNKSVLAEGGLWVTGSMVYFWISAIGLVAFYPVAYYIAKRKQPHWLITVIGVICAIIAASSQEQVGCLLLGLSSAFLVYEFIKTSKNNKFTIPWYLVSLCVVIGTSLLISITAPGNSARVHAELATWLPTFYTTPVLQRIEYSYRWFLEAIINHSGYLLIISWASMAALFAHKKTKNKLDYLFIFILVIACLFAMSKGFESTSYWLDFYATWKPNISKTLTSLNLLPWGVVLICTTIAPLVLFYRQTTGYLLSLLFLASFASGAIMLFSPTLYASQWRSYFVPSVMLMIIVYVLFDKILHKYWSYRYVLIGIILSLALSHYIFQLARLAHNI